MLAGVILLVAGVCFLFIAVWNERNFEPAIVIAALIDLTIGICLIGREINPERIEPIEVYRGHTTLQITYQDSVVLDSTVVWLDEYDPKKK